MNSLDFLAVDETSSALENVVYTINDLSSLTVAAVPVVQAYAAQSRASTPTAVSSTCTPTPATPAHTLVTAAAASTVSTIGVPATPCTSLTHSAINTTLYTRLALEIPVYTISCPPSGPVQSGKRYHTAFGEVQIGPMIDLTKRAVTFLMFLEGERRGTHLIVIPRLWAKVGIMKTIRHRCFMIWPLDKSIHSYIGHKLAPVTACRV
ncbi:hypothetical protein BV22DRAFT_1135462 [Leucogyrophana mollusca]|uniref:Uncharacterized protein n=1 Tax=Leucogyrophana mollusca TaxID=85980 RepID=A0ACB8AV12_9AGAM|nr:hypothetical protein BV22DRAFT_1135462 [Leucogyrophana mollusca]